MTGVAASGGDFVAGRVAARQTVVQRVGGCLWCRSNHFGLHGRGKSSHLQPSVVRACACEVVPDLWQGRDGVPIRLRPCMARLKGTELHDEDPTAIN